MKADTLKVRLRKKVIGVKKRMMIDVIAFLFLLRRCGIEILLSGVCDRRSGVVSCWC